MMSVTIMDVATVTLSLLVGAVCLLAYWVWRSQETFQTFKKMGLPGPPPSFLYGSTGVIKKVGFCPAYVEWGKKYGKFYGVFLPKPTFVVSDPELLRDLMVKKFNAFPNRMPQAFFNFKPWKDGLGRLRNNHWRHVRQQLSPTFSSGKLKRMVPAIDRVVQNLHSYVKDKALSGEDVELKYMAGCFTMDTIAGAAFGLQTDSLKNPNDPFNTNGLALLRFNSWMLTVLMVFPKLGPILKKFGISLIRSGPTKFFEDMIRAAIQDRRNDSTNHSDFLQIVVDAEKEGASREPVDAEIDHSDVLNTPGHSTAKGLTEDEMIGNGLIFFFAGYDTTAIALSFTLFHLAGNPEALKKAQAEVDEKLGKKPVRYDTASELTYLDMCINESIRLNPPGFLVDREAAEDTELRGYPVKKGTRVVIPAYVLHRDPDHWPQPEAFMPERHSPEAKAARHPFAFMPFGHGPRNCIGMRLAQLEMRMALATVLQHHTPLLCDKSVYPPVLATPQISMRPRDGLWVRFQARD